MNEIKEMLFNQGASIVGFADLRDLPERVRFNLDYGISIGIRLNPKIIENIQSGPNRQYHQEYLRVNQLLDQLSSKIASILRSKGYQAMSIAATVEGMNNYDLSTLLPHKTVATKAGLGWIGKNALLITKSFGSAIRLTTVLTNIEFSSAEPIKTSLCGSCQACVEGCPANAIIGKNWHLGIPRNKIYNTFLCSDFMQKLVKKMKINNRICGQCIVSCPWTKKYIIRYKNVEEF
ncbi:MAG: epoxyqueuosine reductase [Firmicutes bacterium HGW-Firmicutes-7]|nr:MAG: epoxyqueuosine reductase [Firmicutes bacterium HGW-Firmicutes-7]